MMPSEQSRYRRTKAILAVVIAILSIPFIIMAMMGAAGERR